MVIQSADALHPTAEKARRYTERFGRRKRPCFCRVRMVWGVVGWWRGGDGRLQRIKRLEDLSRTENVVIVDCKEKLE